MITKSRAKWLLSNISFLNENISNEDLEFMKFWTNELDLDSEKPPYKTYDEYNDYAIEKFNAMRRNNRLDDINI